MKKSVLVQLLLVTVLIVSGYAETSEIQINQFQDVNNSEDNILTLSQMNQSRTYIDSNGRYIELPLGGLSFADKVISFEKKDPANSFNSDPTKAVGAPDNKTLSLSCGGSAIFEFTNNTLLDVDGADLFIFEYDPEVEPTKVAISRNGIEWIDIGEINGGTVGIDISSYVNKGDIFNFVKLTDLKTACNSNYPGADIDAIAAVGSGIKVSLNSTILFDSGKFKLKNSASEAIAQKLKEITNVNNMKSLIIGHTDNIGSSESNMKLSQNRTAAVKKYFVKFSNIDASNITTKSMGETQPIATNDTEEGRQKNRRVEIIFTTQGQGTTISVDGTLITKSTNNSMNHKGYYFLPFYNPKYILAVSKSNSDTATLLDVKTKKSLFDVTLPDLNSKLSLINSLSSPVMYSYYMKGGKYFIYFKNIHEKNISVEVYNENAVIYPIDESRFYISYTSNKTNTTHLKLYNSDFILLGHFELSNTTTKPTAVNTRGVKFHFDREGQLVFYYQNGTFLALDKYDYRPLADYNATMITKWEAAKNKGTKSFIKQDALGIGAEGTAIALNKQEDVYVVGTVNVLEGNGRSSFKHIDTFISKFNREGKKLWSKQFGTNYKDIGKGVAVDQKGDIYIVGTTTGDLEGKNKNSNRHNEAFLVKYNQDGKKLWAKQLATNTSDEGNGIVIDQKGYIYIVGTTQGDFKNRNSKKWRESSVFLSKFNNKGKELWTKQYSFDYKTSGSSIAIDNKGSLYIVGLMAADADYKYKTFLGKINSNGKKIWLKDFIILKHTNAKSVVTDAEGSIYVAGVTYSSVKRGAQYFAFITKYSSEGNKLWLKKVGTYKSIDYGTAVATDESSNVFLTGFTNGYFGDDHKKKPLGLHDIFVTKFNGDGESSWTKQFGTNTHDKAYAISTGAKGSVYITGMTYGNLTGTKSKTTSNSKVFLINVNDYKVPTADKSKIVMAPRLIPAVIIKEVLKTENSVANGMVLETTDIVDFNNSKSVLTIKPTNNLAYQKIWTKQYGTDKFDMGRSVITDSEGNAYVTGYTQGELEGNGNRGKLDVFLTKHNKEGKKLWTKQYGTEEKDSGSFIAMDSKGNLYITGNTRGELDGIDNSGGDDVFLTKFSPEGEKIWMKQYGTEGNDYGSSVAIDIHDNIYIVGSTNSEFDGIQNSGRSDVFLTKFNSDGIKLWTKQYGSKKSDSGKCVTTDSQGSIYITGNTYGDLDGNKHSGKSDIFLTKFTSDGMKVWTKQYGSDKHDKGNSIVTDNQNNIYLTGYTGGSLDGNKNSGSEDVFLMKFNSDGTKLWTKQYGSGKNDQGKSVLVDNQNNIYLTGSIKNGKEGNKRVSSVFLTQFSNDGELLRTEEYGTGSNDSGYSVAMDKQGNIYITGNTSGEFEGEKTSGSYDIFLTKFSY